LVQGKTSVNKGRKEKKKLFDHMIDSDRKRGEEEG